MEAGHQYFLKVSGDSTLQPNLRTMRQVCPEHTVLLPDSKPLLLHSSLTTLVFPLLSARFVVFVFLKLYP